MQGCSSTAFQGFFPWNDLAVLLSLVLIVNIHIYYIYICIYIYIL